MAEKKGLVLCVDDEPNILRSLQWLLQKDFDVKTATSGQDGLALVKQNDFDVVISDQRMPGMMGSEFLREVCKLSPRSMRILLTGYSDLQAILRSVNEGEVFRFINKPWDINELPKVVIEAVGLAKTVPLPPVHQEANQSESPDHKADIILVVDDDASMAELIRSQVENPGNVTYAKNIAEAVAAFDNNELGIVVSDTSVGNMDTTRMLRVLKHDNPSVVTVVYTDETDADDVIKLINQGQIFRFIPKPVKPSILKLALTAAAGKRVQLKAHPEYVKRHAVQEVSSDEKKSLLKDLEQMTKTADRAAASADAPKSGGGGFLSGLRKLFGG